MRTSSCPPAVRGLAARAALSLVDQTKVITAASEWHATPWSTAAAAAERLVRRTAPGEVSKPYSSIKDLESPTSKALQDGWTSGRARARPVRIAATRRHVRPRHRGRIGNPGGDRQVGTVSATTSRTSNGNRSRIRCGRGGAPAGRAPTEHRTPSLGWQRSGRCSEFASNQRPTRRGRRSGPVRRTRRSRVELVAIVSGPGIDCCRDDGVSTAGTLGVGLGALRSAGSPRLDVHSLLGRGTVTRCRVRPDNGSRCM